ncbi:MAG: Crotonyl-CoA reductase [Ignavibacteria bacterium]|nr:Crotonyl-CoA reductase [Ignavibacteria bacterium]
MKAAVLVRTGSTDDLKKNYILEEVPLPEINENEVLIQVKAASLNHRDLWITNGKYSKIKLPVILGSDCSGIVYAKGKNADKIKEGDEVIINPGINWGNNEEFQGRDFSIFGMPENGTLAEFVKVRFEYIYKKPEHLNFSEASAIPLAGVTAYRGLFVKAGITENDRILITGIGGGVACTAFKFALGIGAKVFITSSDERKINKALNLGALSGVNYKNENWAEDLADKSQKSIDIVFDSAGGFDFSKFIQLCSNGGRIVSYGASIGDSGNINLHKLYWKQLKIFGTTMGSQNDFMRMLGFVNEFKIKPVVDSEFVLDDIHKAFQRMSNSEQFGKIIVLP